MHAWIRSSLMLVAFLGAAAVAAQAGDLSANPQPVQSMAQDQTTTVGQPVQPTQPNQAVPGGQPVQPLQQGQAIPAGQGVQPMQDQTGQAATPQASPDNSGEIDDEEAPPAGAAPAAPAPAEEQASGGPKTPTDKIVDKFMELDTDDSKSVSMDEYMAMVQQRAQARFAAMDANGDGQVTADEYRQFWKSRMAHWYRLNR